MISNGFSRKSIIPEFFTRFLFSNDSGNLLRCSMMDIDVSTKQEHIVEGPLISFVF